MAELQQHLEQAQERQDIAPEESIGIFERIIDSENNSEEASKAKEESIYSVSALYSKLGRSESLIALLRKIRPFFAVIPKARTAKIVRTILDHLGKISGTNQMQIDLCKEFIEWSKAEKRTFLRQRIESRLAALMFESKDYSGSLALITSLLREVRKLDDKPLLVEIQLLESRVHHMLKNVPKSKAALTGSRTAANAIYCPPLLQAEIDIMAGILHAEERDYKTAYSYFFESFEAYNSLDDPRAVLSLKYMLLSRILSNVPEDVQTILSGKNALRYGGREVEAMRSVATAYQQRSLHSFETCVATYAKELREDPIMHIHLSALYDNLLEQHLLRIIEPFSRVQINHVAKLINLPVEKVEPKLSQMILDKKLNGILDHSANALIVFEDQKQDKIYPAALETMSNMGNVVDSLFSGASKLS